MCEYIGRNSLDMDKQPYNSLQPSRLLIHPKPDHLVCFMQFDEVLRTFEQRMNSNRNGAVR